MFIVVHCIAFAIVDLQEIALLPPELLRMSSCRLVNDWYKESFSDLLRYEQAAPEKDNMNRLLVFCFVLNRI